MLSFRARGVLWYIRTHPGCPTNASWLCTRAKEGRDAIRTAIAELVDHGYLAEERQRDPDTGMWKRRHILVSDRHPDDLEDHPDDNI